MRMCVYACMCVCVCRGVRRVLIWRECDEGLDLRSERCVKFGILTF